MRWRMPGRRWLAPSLVRRMLIAQAIVVSLLLAAVVSTIAMTSSDDSDYLRSAGPYQAIMLAVENMADDRSPYDLLSAMDRAFVSLPQPMAEGPVAEGFIVRKGSELIYSSTRIPATISNTVLDTVQAITIADGTTYHALTRQSERSDTRVTYVVRYHRMFWLIMLYELGLVPLLVFLPFLLLAGWLSVHLAFRPWRRVSREIAQRNFSNLTPLPLQPRHQELLPMLEAVNALLARMAATFDRERSFIADAAHELRTPLAALRVNIETLESNRTLPVRDDLMQNLLLGMHRIQRLVDQLLKLMRSESHVNGHVAQPIDVHELLQERLAVLDALANASQVDLVLDGDTGPVIDGERESLISMLDNLIENAIKYSPPGGTITVCVKEFRGEVCIRIRDQGPGIAEAFRDRVFDRFFRAPDQSQTGSGLGLSIVRSAVERHGGRIRLEHAMPHGLMVTLHFTPSRAGSIKMHG